MMRKLKHIESDAIDYRRFGIVGYNHMPSYMAHKNATPHLVRFGTLNTLCGAEKRSKNGGKGRVSGVQRRDMGDKPVCADCVRVQAEQEVPEHTYKMRPGACPVLSESEGCSMPHNWISKRPRCAKCPKVNQWKPTERCPAKHETYAYCNFCNAVDKDRHLCDYWVGRSMGLATDFGPCDLKAKNFEQYKRHMNDSKRWGWLCHLHNAAGEQKRADKYNAARAAEDARWAERDKREDDKRDAMDILLELAEWVAKNRELVEEDEWLARLADRIGKNDYVMDKLGKRGNV